MALAADATNKTTLDFIEQLNEDPSLLFRESGQSKEKLLGILQNTFSNCKYTTKKLFPYPPV